MVRLPCFRNELFWGSYRDFFLDSGAKCIKFIVSAEINC